MILEREIIVVVRRRQVSNTTTTNIVCGRILTYDRRRNIERKVVVDPTDTDGARAVLRSIAGTVAEMIGHIDDD